MLVFGERGKPEYSGKNLLELSYENQQTQASDIWRPIRESNLGHIGGRPVLLPLRQHCSLNNWFYYICSMKTTGEKKQPCNQL